MDEVAKYGKTMREWYRDIYLRSGHWMQLRLRKLVHANRKCERCGAVGNLDIHHKNYRDIYDVEMDDLEALCRACHNLEHHIKPQSKVVFKKKRAKKKARKKKKASKYKPGWNKVKRPIKKQINKMKKSLADKAFNKEMITAINSRIAELARELEKRRIEFGK